MSNAPTPVQGLFETHLTVAELGRAVVFYRDVVGLDLASEHPERRCAFMWIGGRGRSMLGLWETGTGPNFMTLHTAFACDVDELLQAPDRLKAAGVQPLGFEREPADEPVVIGWMPALSLYFKDLDGHLIEYLAMLDEDPRPEAGVVPYSEWRRPAKG